MAGVYRKKKAIAPVARGALCPAPAVRSVRGQEAACGTGFEGPRPPYMLPRYKQKKETGRSISCQRMVLKHFTP